MPTLIDANDLRSRFDIASDFGDDRLTPHIESADRRLQKWVGATNYADATLVDILKNAEAHLAMHYAVLGFNSPISAKGILIQARSTEGQGREIRQYMPPEDTQKIAQMYLDLAQEMVEDLMITDATPAAPFETIADTECTLDTSCEAVTRSFDGGSCR